MSPQLPIEGSVVSASAGEAIEKNQFITLVRGFSRVFWGLTLSAVLLLSQTNIQVFSGLNLPAYVFGILVHFWGLVTLMRAGKISARWQMLLMQAVVLVFLQVYFFPFLLWWKAMPYILFFTVNVVTMAAAAVISLVISNMIAADFFKSVAMQAEQMEARIYAGVVVAFMAIPLIIALAFSIYCAARYQTAFIDEFVDLLRRVPLWICVIGTIPYSLTLAILWKARDRSYQQFCLTK